MSSLTLKIVTPDGVNQTVLCDSVSLWMAADAKGKGEGSLGIHKGHTEAVIALGKGPLFANLEGKRVYSAHTDGGFATVLADTVTIVSPHINE